jgi:hypothetical protein
MSQRNDRARVQTLLDEGRITAAEAEILFAALDEVEGKSNSEGDPSEDDPEGARRLPPRVTPEQAREEARARAHEAAEQARAKARQARAETKQARQAADVNAEPSQLGGEKSGYASSYQTQPPQPPAAETPTLPQPPSPPNSAQPTGGSINTYPVGQRWARISGFCGDLDVRSAPNISEPSISGNASFSWDGSVFAIRTPSKDSEGGRNWLHRLHRAAGDLKVTLPEGMGLELSVTAGDGNVRGVREVRGNFTGGDFDLRDAEHIDLTTTAGDVSISLRPRSGKQRLRATSGDIDLTLLGGSSVTVSGKATCGDLELPQGFTRDGGFGTQRFAGTVGAGEAELELRLTAGDVDVKLEHA